MKIMKDICNNCNTEFTWHLDKEDDILAWDTTCACGKCEEETVYKCGSCGHLYYETEYHGYCQDCIDASDEEQDR